MLFQPTRPLRGATAPFLQAYHIQSHFNPRAPCGARLAPRQTAFRGRQFQPTRPLRGATCSGHQRPVTFLFQPTRPLRGATIIGDILPKVNRFQPTRPLRGATQMTCVSLPPCLDFNPRAPCGARPMLPRRFNGITLHFNPRAPCGARPRKSNNCGLSYRFQPTRPLRGATWNKIPSNFVNADFNPRAPCGARHQPTQAGVDHAAFQPTRPLRGATSVGAGGDHVIGDFNPRAPCGARRGILLPVIFHADFNPRAPCGARQRFHLKYANTFGFQPTRPLRGATVISTLLSWSMAISTHAPLAGRDLSGVD